MPYYCPHLKHIHSQNSGTKKETEKIETKMFKYFGGKWMSGKRGGKH